MSAWLMSIAPGLSAAGGLSLVGAQVRGHVSLIGARIDGKLSLAGAVATDLLAFSVPPKLLSTVPPKFEGGQQTSVAGDLDLSRARIPGQVVLLGARVGRDLIDGLKSRASDLREQAEQKLQDANIGGSKQSFGSDVSSVGSDVGYGSTGYDYNRNR